MTNLEQVLKDVLADKNTNLLPENLKEGIICLGIEGTYKNIMSQSDYDECLELSEQILGEDVSL